MKDTRYIITDVYPDLAMSEHAAVISVNQASYLMSLARSELIKGMLDELALIRSKKDLDLSNEFMKGYSAAIGDMQIINREAE